MTKMFIRTLQSLNLSTLEDDDKQTLVSWCKSALQELEGDKSEEKGDKSKSKDAGETPSDWQGGGGQPTFVFNIGASETWPASTGTSRRERDIAQRKEQSNV